MLLTIGQMLSEHINIDSQHELYMIDAPGTVATKPSCAITSSHEATATNLFHHRRYACVRMNDLTRVAKQLELDFTLLVTYRTTSGVETQFQYEELLQSALDETMAKGRNRDSISY